MKAEERLEDVRYVQSRDGTTASPDDPFSDIYPDTEFAERAKRLADHIDKQHRLSNTPITVEGLVDQGWTSGGGEMCEFFTRPDCPVMVKHWSGGSLKEEWQVWHGEMPCHPQPTNMLDLARLAR